MSGPTSDQIKSVVGVGLKVMSFTSPIIRVGTQVFSQLRCLSKSKSESTSCEGQQLNEKNNSENTEQSSSAIVSRVEDAMRMVGPAIQIAVALRTLYKAVKPEESVNSNYTPCCSKRQNGAHREQQVQRPANLGAFEVEEPLLQKQKDLKQSTRKGMQFENKPRCDICRATSDVRELGLSPCQHIFCYKCLILITKCSTCGKNFKREDFQKLS